MPEATGPKNPTPRVPIQTPMFNEDAAAGFTVSRTWVIFFEKMFRRTATDTAVADGGAGGPFIRSLLLNDTTVGNNIAHNVTTFALKIGQASKIRRVEAVLKETITADLRVRYNVVYPNGETHVIGTFTVPHSTALKHAIAWVVPSASILWDSLPDLSVLTCDIVASDGSKNKNGVCEFTIEFMSRGAGTATAPGLGVAGVWDAGTTYAKDDIVYAGGNSYVSLQAGNTGHDPLSEGAWWQIVAAGSAGTIAIGTVSTGAAGSSATITNTGTPSAAVLDIAIPRGDVGATGSTGATGGAGATGAAGSNGTNGVGVPTGGSAAQYLRKSSGTNYDDAWATPTEAELSFSDVTTNNVSITKHGLAPKAPNDATKYLDGTGAYSVPAGSGGGGGNMNFRATWSGGATYAVGDVVIYSGGLYYRAIAPSGTSGHIQSKAATFVHSLAFDSNVTAGSLLVVAFGDEGALGGAPTDTLGTVYTLAAKHDSSANKVAVYYGIAPSSGANTVAYTSSGSWYGITISEFGGVNAVVDTTATAYNSSSPSSVSITTGAANCFLYAGVRGIHSANTFAATSGSGFTLSAQANGRDAIAGEYRTAATAASYTPSFDIAGDGADNSPIVAVSFTTGAINPATDTTNWTKIATI